MRRTRKSAAANGAAKAQPEIGLMQWFRFGDEEHVERVLSDLAALGVRHLRTGVSWADWFRPQGPEWYDWLLPRLAQQVHVLPCVTYTPPSLGIVPRSSAPPRNPKLYADFLDVLVTRSGEYFETVELWNEPNNINNWDWRLDPDWAIFYQMIGGASHWMKQRGKRTVLGGVSPTNLNRLRLLCEKGVLENIDVVGLCGLPGTWEHDTGGDWTAQIRCLDERMAGLGYDGPLWITGTGYSTWRNDEHRQLVEFLKLVEAPVERVYWHSVDDLDPDWPIEDGFIQDERNYHFGLKRSDGTPKLLYRVWASGGLPAIRSFAGLVNGAPRVTAANGAARCMRPAPLTRFRSVPAVKAGDPVLITGGAGFIGTNVAAKLAENGHRVLLYDNLSRPGVERNLRWLIDEFGDQIEVHVADVRDVSTLRRSIAGAQCIFHFAAQVAVTTSLVDPINDFSINARGALNVLEACRSLKSPPPLLFTSTNKVYGNLEDMRLIVEDDRYVPASRLLHEHGVAEDRPLDFHSPYGCSKGTADQYILDYARCYDLPTVVFRMSCIYGPHQCGTEDQGWVAHFVRQALKGEPITFYGDGRQVRDLLYVEDLVRAMLAAIDGIEATRGKAFNIGGGPENACSLLEVVDLIGRLQEHVPEIQFAPWRQGDQRYYVSDTRAFQRATGWQPAVGAREGIERLYRWLARNERSLSAMLV